jgi:hypothetical protein
VLVEDVGALAEAVAKRLITRNLGKAREQAGGRHRASVAARRRTKDHRMALAATIVAG